MKFPRTFIFAIAATNFIFAVGIWIILFLGCRSMDSLYPNEQQQPVFSRFVLHHYPLFLFEMMFLSFYWIFVGLGDERQREKILNALGLTVCLVAITFVVCSLAMIIPFLKLDGS